MQTLCPHSGSSLETRQSFFAVWIINYWNQVPRMMVVNPPQECFNQEEMFLSKWWALVQARVMFRTTLHRLSHLNSHSPPVISGAETKAKKRQMHISSHLSTKRLSSGNPGALCPVPRVFRGLCILTGVVPCQLQKVYCL